MSNENSNTEYDYTIQELFEQLKQDPEWEQDPFMRQMIADAMLDILGFAL